MTIGEFRGKYYFLSNFSPSKIELDGYIFDNGESAFQSFKNLSQQASFQGIEPNIAKRKGRRVTLRHDWDKVKDGVMYQVVKAKFTQNEELKTKLLATQDNYLIEGNRWNDTYWGVDIITRKGKNKLGKILMQVREELREKGAIING